MDRIDVRGRGARASFASASMLALALQLAAGCSRGGYTGGKPDGSVRDAQAASEDFSMQGTPDLRTADLGGAKDLAASGDLRAPGDLAAPSDLASSVDMRSSSPITGGPCLSGVSGATAFRVRWTDSGGRATVNYEEHGLPDKSRWKVGVYGYGFGFTPQYVDPFLGPGGLQLDGTSFIDVELSTVGVSSIASVSLAIYGRSYSTGSSGSFNWQTATGVGSTATNYVSNVTPYRWYPADATTEIDPGDGRILLRIKAGGSSGSLVVNRLEMCIDAS